MRTRFFLVIAATVFLFACYSSDNAIPPASTPISQETAPSPTIDEQSQATEDHEGAESKKQWAIARFNEAFSMLNDWDAIASGDATSGNSVCGIRERFDQMSLSLRYVEGMDVFDGITVSWDELGRKPAPTYFAHARTGLAYASALQTILAEPQEKRRNRSCGSGEGTMELSDTGRVASELRDTLKAIGATPTDIGLNGFELRALIRADFRARIANLRGQKEKTIERELTIEDGLRWYFSLNELDITEKDVPAGFAVPPPDQPIQRIR